ncbi:MAG: hypothetical protein ACRCZF_19475, partial [Gemmataceae bacterium]
DWLRTLRWRLAPGPTWREQVLRTVKLLEQRSRAVGTPRPVSVTASNWLKSMLLPTFPEVPRMMELADWAAYAPHDWTPNQADTILPLCQRAVAELHLRRWKELARLPAEVSS